jgi:hypothetical protein
MNQSCVPNVPHTYALKLIARYKLRISDKASALKKRTNLKHTYALDEICKRERYKNYYMCKKISNALLERATFIGKKNKV